MKFELRLALSLLWRIQSRLAFIEMMHSWETCRKCRLSAMAKIVMHRERFDVGVVLARGQGFMQGELNVSSISWHRHSCAS